MTIYLTYLYICSYKYCSASALYDILNIYPGNTDYFDFSSAEMIAAVMNFAQQCLTLTDTCSCI